MVSISLLIAELVLLKRDFINHNVISLEPLVCEFSLSVIFLFEFIVIDLYCLVELRFLWLLLILL